MLAYAGRGGTGTLGRRAGRKSSLGHFHQHRSSIWIAKPKPPKPATRIFFFPLNVRSWDDDQKRACDTGARNRLADPMTSESHRRFRDLFFAHGADLQAFVAALVGTRGARDDVIMEVAQALWLHFESYDPARPFGQWARSVAANKVLHIQRLNPAFPARLSPEATLAVAEAWDAAERAEGVCGRPAEIDALRACTEALPSRSARLIDLRYREAHPVSEIATQAESMPEAVYQTLGRLRLKLAACMREHAGRTPAASAAPTSDRPSA